MAYAEKLDGYFRGRYWRADGKLDSVRNVAGKVVHFRTKREAEKAANDAEAKARAGIQHAPIATSLTFGDYASRWYAAQDLAMSTMQNYRRHIEEHLLPTFESALVGRVTEAEVNAWESAERAAGYAESSIKTWRGTLHLIFEDATAEGLRTTNPANRRRGRGRRAGRSRKRGPEKVVTDALGLLLVAERTALLAGRDDEFVAVMLLGSTGMRWGELVGLETGYTRPDAVRVEWQLYELDTGQFVRCPPKDDSYRTIDLPPWLAGLVATHVARTQPKPCRCHAYTYVFRGLGAANGSTRQPGAKLVDVARRAEVSTGTVSNVLNRPETVPEATRSRVAAAIADLAYVRSGGSGEVAAHWRRSGFATWLFHPAAAGTYPARAPYPQHPVPILGEPWPGVPVRGRNASRRSDSCWLPIAAGLTPHGLRHAHRTQLEEMGVPPRLIDDRMGHEDGSVQARYTHVTTRMRRRLLDDLTEVWLEALEERRKIDPRSPVAVLDRLLQVPRQPAGRPN